MRWAFATSSMLVLLSGCVGDTPSASNADSGPAAGEEGGACYADKTCNKNKPLVCLSNLCVKFEQDGGTDAASDVAIDAGGSCSATKTTDGTSVYCTNGTTCERPAKFCCTITKSLQCGATACGDPVTLNCDDSADCTGQQVCCTTMTLTNTSTCPYQTGADTAGSQCKNSCGSGELELCGKDSACGGGKTCHSATYLGTTFGICN